MLNVIANLGDRVEANAADEVKNDIGEVDVVKIRQGLQDSS